MGEARHCCATQCATCMCASPHRWKPPASITGGCTQAVPETACRAGTRAGPAVTPTASQEARALRCALGVFEPRRSQRGIRLTGTTAHSPTMQYIRPNPEVSLVARSMSSPTSCAGPQATPLEGRTCLAPMLALQEGRCGAPGVLVACVKQTDADRLRCTCARSSSIKERLYRGWAGWACGSELYFLPAYCFGVTCSCGNTHVQCL